MASLHSASTPRGCRAGSSNAARLPPESAAYRALRSSPRYSTSSTQELPPISVFFSASSSSTSCSEASVSPSNSDSASYGTTCLFSAASSSSAGAANASESSTSSTTSSSSPSSSCMGLGGPPVQSPRTAKRSAAGPKGEGASQSDRRKIPLNRRAVVLMKNWFEKHSNNPYPSEEQKLYFALKGGITLEQVTSWFSNKRNRTDTTNSKREKLALLQQLRLLQDKCGRTRVGAVADINGGGGVMADCSVPAPRPSAASDGTGVDANGQSIHSLQLFGVGPVGHSVALAGGNQYDVAMPCQPVIYETTAGEVRAVGAGAHQRSSLMDSIFDCPQPQLPDWNGPGPSVYRSPAIDFPYCEQYFGSGYQSLLQMPSNSNEPFGLFESNLTFSQPSFSPPSPPAAAQMPLVQRTYPYYGNEAIARVAGSGQSVGQQTILQPAYASRMSLPTISFCGIQSPGNGVGSGHWNRTASNIVSSVEEQQKYGQCVSADYPSVCVAARDRHELYQ